MSQPPRSRRKRLALVAVGAVVILLLVLLVSRRGGPAPADPDAVEPGGGSARASLFIEGTRAPLLPGETIALTARTEPAELLGAGRLDWRVSVGSVAGDGERVRFTAPATPANALCGPSG
jgi:hypothetical protein